MVDISKLKKIIQQFNYIDEDDFYSYELKNFVNDIVKSLKLNELRDDIEEITLKLSQVPEIGFAANTKEVAIDNQQRLNTIFNLWYHFIIIKSKYDYYKKYKEMDSEQIFSFIDIIQKFIIIYENYYEEGE